MDYNLLINGLIRMHPELGPMEQTQMQSAAEIARRSNRVKVLAESAMMIALAGVLNAIQIYTFPQGGSVTAGGMVPIFFLALRRGAKVGIAAGAVLGLIVLYIPPNPFVVHPVQFLLDYPIAFGALGLAGFFPSRPLIGVGAGILGRFVSHFISGVVFFATFAPAGVSPFVYSAVYNGSYLSVEFVVSTIIIYLLLERNALRAYL